MWCRQCNLETNEPYCPICGSKTAEDVPVKIYWCKDCSIPIIHFMTAVDKGVCPNCGRKTRQLCADLRPVFPEEENEYIFTKWFESLVVQETTAKVSSTIGITDEKINAGEMTPAQVHVIKRIFKQLKFNGNTGHGFAAEQANNLADNIRGWKISSKA